MSTDVTDSPLGPPAGPPAGPPDAGARPASVPRGATWRLSAHGVRTVAVLELRQRVRSTRWVIVLGVWFVILGGLTTLIRFAVHRTMDPEILPAWDAGTAGQVAVLAAQEAERASHAAGRTMFGIIVFLVLGLAGLVAPALTATSVNGDRAAGVLATMQTTLLSAAEIAVGKLLAAWATALALLVTAVPFILWAYLEGGTPAGRLAVILGLLAVMLLVVCAVALGWSAVAARTSTSAVLTYLSVAFLGLGLPILFALSTPLVMQTDQVTVYESVSNSTMPPADGESPTYSCALNKQEMQRPHTERIWWLLAANPFVVLADAAPRPTGQAADSGSSDPLSAIRSAVREARLGPAHAEDWCSGNAYSEFDPATGQEATWQSQKPAELAAIEADRKARLNGLGVVWPFGLAADLALGAGFVVLTVLRLRAPARALPRGTRVA